MSDTISRQALCKYALNQKDKAITPNDIMRFPSADRPTGEWIQNNNSLWDCSKCGLRALTEKGDYCLSLCGAKMKGAEHEID